MYCFALQVVKTLEKKLNFMVGEVLALSMIFVSFIHIIVCS